MSHERLTRVFLVFYLIPSVFTQLNVTCDGPTKVLTFHEGENVTLQVSRNQPQLANINWNFEQNIIAITGPGQPIALLKYSYKYAGRLSSASDGSLEISRLTAADGQIYRAEIFDANRTYVCVQLYDVTTDGSRRNSPSLPLSEACSPTVQILYSIGQNVILKLPSNSRTASVYWDINNIDHIVTTQPGGVMFRQNSSYNGKLSVTNDGSLRILNLTTKEQRVYRADHFNSDWVHLCTQHYDVRVKNVTCDGPTKTLTFDEGENVTLQVSRNQPHLANVNWNFEQNVIAITRPGQPIELQKYSYKYAGRLSSSSDGSLIISKLTAADGHVYRAEIFDGNRTYVCVQLYDVTTDGPGRNSPSVIFLTLRQQSVRADTDWSIVMSKQQDNHLGEGITQILQNQKDKRPGGVMYRPNSSYNGRVSVTNDGSLKIFNVTIKDQRVFRADHFNNEWVHLCTQHYDVRVKKTFAINHHEIQNLIRLALSACLLLATLAILIYHIKTESCRKNTSMNPDSQGRVLQSPNNGQPTFQTWR
ncbi:pregnancy-specific glycoprotein 22-like [Anomaloglossus baeobatrachus]|uniref:pregnancy-specific glycoprotein 22-like n=1 Tax=Anomaloglossus baeobatrachus TaxID=238106 RepID=UPI003F4FF8D1